MSSTTSLVVLAVKRVMDKGSSAYPEASKDRYNSFYTKSVLETTTFPTSSSSDFLDYVIDDCMGQLSSKLGDERDQIVANLEIIRDLDALSDGAAEASAINQMFDGGKGKFFTFMYAFVPNSDYSEINAEQLTISFNLRLADTVYVLYHSKKTLFGTRKTEEKQKIPAVISKETVINSLAMAFAPFVLETISGPSNIISDLKAQAKAAKSTTAKDTHRMVYNPMTKTSVLVTDPAILKLIPARWETFVEEHSLSVERLASASYDF